MEIQRQSDAFWRTSARNPHLGEGPWYHGTNADFSTGASLLPGDTVGKSHGKFSGLNHCSTQGPGAVTVEFYQGSTYD